MEIQRLIGRSLRAAVDLQKLGERTITIDCDVIQADGGTRTASITGACVALVDALEHLRSEGLLQANPLRHMVASISAGIYQGQAILDLDYAEDSNAETDMNFVMDESGGFIEVQGTAEGAPFAREELDVETGDALHQHQLQRPRRSTVRWRQAQRHRPRARSGSAGPLHRVEDGLHRRRLTVRGEVHAASTTAACRIGHGGRSSGVDES